MRRIDKFMRESKGWEYYIKEYIIPENLLDDLIKKMSKKEKSLVSKYQRLGEDFILTHIWDLDIPNILKYQKLSDEQFGILGGLMGLQILNERGGNGPSPYFIPRNSGMIIGHIS